MNLVDEIVYKRDSMEKAMEILEESDHEIEEVIEQIKKALEELKTVQSQNTIRRLENTVGDINPTKYAMLCNETVETTITNMRKSITSVEEYLEDSNKGFPEIEPMEDIRFVTIPIILPEKDPQEKVEDGEKEFESKEDTEQETVENPQTSEREDPKDIYEVIVPEPEPEPVQQVMEQPQQPTGEYQQPETVPETTPATEPLTEPETSLGTTPIEQIVPITNNTMNNPNWKNPNVSELSEQKSATSKSFAPIAAGAGVAAAAVGVTGAVLYNKHKNDDEEEKVQEVAMDNTVRYNVVEDVDNSQNYDVKNNRVITTSQDFKYN